MDQFVPEKGNFWDDLERFGAAPALIVAAAVPVCYREMAARADAAAARMRAAIPAGVSRPLVQIETGPAPEPVAAYLACLRAGWPVILTGAGDAGIRNRFRPNYVYRRGAGGWQGEADDPESAELHPDLAVLLATSGSAGTPKLVRLSRANIAANAAAIVQSLEIRPADRILLGPPWHYSYGMSLIHTHLACGAALILSGLAVSDAGFWDQVPQVSTLALVPHQFGILEPRGFGRDSWPNLRSIVVGGGRLAPHVVKNFAAQGQRQGWTLSIFYGQTEASPRIAILQPGRQGADAGSIGQTLAGGRLWLEQGELVYEGPNVMLGYARTRTELAAPAGPRRLYTGDLAEPLANGSFHITGRKSRFIKPGGKRISLDEIEHFVHDSGISALAAGQGEDLALFALAGTDSAALHRLVADKYQLPEQKLQVQVLAEFPYLASGKPDYKSLAARSPALPGAANLDAVLKAALRRQKIDAARSFAELGGDSLAWLEVQMALGTRLGQVPQAWETLPVRDLLALKPGKQPRFQPTSPDLILRVLALLAIIAVHTTDLALHGGTWLLLLLTGAALARFQSGNLLAGRVAALWRTMLVPLLVCYFAILAACQIFWKPVDAEWFVLLGNFDRDIHPIGIQPYWFVCLYAQVLVLTGLLFVIPGLRARVAADPFAAGLVAAAVFGLLMLLAQPGEISIYTLRQPLFGLQIIALGWSGFYARNARDKALVSGLVALIFAVFVRQSPLTYGLIVAGSLFAVWGRTLLLPRPLARAILFTGKNAMFIYLAHVAGTVLTMTALGLTGAAAFLLTLVLALVTGPLAQRAYRLARSALKSPRLLAMWRA